MLGRISFAGILGLVALCVGCTLPCHPYDYCGPVYDRNGQNCSNARAGSILSEGDPQSLSPMENQGVISETTANVQQVSPTVKEVEGARQIISVTDRKVEESTEEVAKSQGEADQSMPVLAQPTSTKLRWR